MHEFYKRNYIFPDKFRWYTAREEEEKNFEEFLDNNNLTEE